jgi:hemoglobin
MSEKRSTYDALGGLTGMREILRDFYDRLYADVLIGFFFQPFDKAQLVEQQARFMGRALGGDVAYDGKSMRAAHRPLPILPGHFDRRHTVLRQTLLDHGVPDEAREAWLALDQQLRSHVLRTSEDAIEQGTKLPDEHVRPAQK